MCCVQRGTTKNRAAFFLFIIKTVAETRWQTESRELTVGLVVEDGVGGSDVFACLHVSQL